MQHRDSATWITGIDVSSSYQPNIDWDALKNDPQNVKFVYVRMYGSNHTVQDTESIRNVSEGKRVGIPTGGYYYTVPRYVNGVFNLQDARDQSQQFIDALEACYGVGKYGDLIPMMDFEDSSPYGDFELFTIQQRLDWHNEFRNYFEEQTKRTLGIYTSHYMATDWLNNFNEGVTPDGNPIKDMPLWSAVYESYPAYADGNHPDYGGWTEWQVWQWTWTGQFDGIDSTNTTAQRPDATDTNRSKPLEWIMPPKKVEGVNASDNGADLTLTWNANTEEDIAGYHVYLDGAWHGYKDRTSNTSYIMSGLVSGNTYTIGIRASDMFDDYSEETTEIVYTFDQSTEPIVQVSPYVDKTILRNNALQFTSESFETSTAYPNNFGVVAGNFDGGGLSWGALQYNFKSNSLQPILTDLINQYPNVVKTAFQFSTDPTYYNTLVDVVFNRTNANQILWGDSISIPNADPNLNKRKINATWEGFFNDLGITIESIERQRQASLSYHNDAELWHRQFGLWSRRAYALMFDISTQKGGISQAVKDRVFDEFALIDTTGQTSQWIEYEKLERILNASADIDVGGEWVEDYRGRKYSVINGGTYYGNVIDPENNDLDWYGYAFEWNTFQTDIYVVQTGDTLDFIATEYGTDIYLLDNINPLTDTNNLVVGQAIFVPIAGTAPTMIPYDFRYMKVTYPSSITNPFEINILANTTQLQLGKTISANVNPLYGAIGALIDGNLTNGVYWENQSPPYEVIVDLGEVRSDVTNIELHYAYAHASATVEVSNDGENYIACTGNGVSGNTQLFGTPYIAIPNETTSPLPIPTVTILNISKLKISDEEGMNKTDITFTFDTDVSKFTVNVNGVSHDTGIVAHSGGGLTVLQLANMTVFDLAQQTVQQISFIVAGYEIVAEIDFTELYQEGANRINFYGKNLDGVWTPYQQ